MIKGIALVTRKPGMPDDEFHRYWREVHGPIATSITGLRRYVQSHQAPETYADGMPAYDGVAELSFADFAAFDAYWSSERIQAIFAADAPRFLDAANSTAFLAEETRVIWP
jgi:uncharacterized protein (TIGR02118 family)